jgi:hypothetical protein
MNLALTALLMFCLIAWGFVLVPPAVRLLSGVIRPSDSIGSFRNKMAVLAGSTPSSYLTGPSAPAGVPSAQPAAVAPRQVHDLAERRRVHASRNTAASRRAAKARRRNIFTGLLASVPVTLMLAVAAGGAAWMLFGLSLLAFAAYTSLLVQMQQRAIERRRKVAVLPTPARPVAAQGELRRISVVGR